MGILLDGGILLLLIVLLAAWWNRAVSSALLTLASCAAALAAAVLFTLVLSGFAADLLFRPAVERAAANDLADLVSAPHLATGEETVRNLSFASLLREAPAPFTQVLEKYGTGIEAVREAYALSPEPVTVLRAVSRGMAGMLGQVSVFGVLWLVLILLFRWASRRLEDHGRPPRRLKGARRLWPPLAAALTAVVIVWGVSLLLEWALPYLEPRSLFLSRELLDSAQIYTILNRINPFAWLCSR